MIEFIKRTIKSGHQRSVAVFLFLQIGIITGGALHAQQMIGFGVHADPVICWFSSDTKETKNEGIRPGFNFGLTYYKYFAPNYSFSTGISLISAGGSLVNSNTIVMEFSNFKSTVLPGKSVIYRIQYLSVPLGLHLKTNQIGYINYFCDLGLDPKVVIGAKVDIPSLDISGEKAVNELNTFNIAYHVTAGFEYSLGGTTALVVGLNYENNFRDITRDIGDQPKDKISHKLLSLRLGINF